MALKAGIVGYGLAGRIFHAPALVSAGFEVTAICARALDKKAAAHQDFPKAIIVTSIDEILDEDLDLIVIASTNDVHVAHAKAAISSGVATVVDKPVARTYLETLELFELAERNHVLLAAFFNRLWDSDSLTVKKALSEDVIGTPFRLDARFERFRPQLNPSAWRESTDPELGGGILLDLQTHLVSTALDWFGPAELVHASIRAVRGAADDDVVLTLRHQSGVDSYLSASAIVGSPGPRVRLLGDKGSLVIEDLDHQEGELRKGFMPQEGSWLENSLITSEARIHKGESSFNFSGIPGAYQEFYRLFREALEIGSPLPVSRDLALQVAAILDQAREITVR